MTIPMNLVPSITPYRDASYHTVASVQGLAAAWHWPEVFLQAVFRLR